MEGPTAGEPFLRASLVEHGEQMTSQSDYAGLTLRTRRTRRSGLAEPPRQPSTSLTCCKTHSFAAVTSCRPGRATDPTAPAVQPSAKSDLLFDFFFSAGAASHRRSHTGRSGQLQATARPVAGVCAGPSLPLLLRVIGARGRPAASPASQPATAPRTAPCLPCHCRPAARP